MNKGRLIGRIAQDVKIEKNNSSIFAALSLDIDESWFSDGEVKSRTQRVHVKASGQAAEKLETMKPVKGNLLMIEGRMNNYSREMDGQRLYFSEVLACSIEIIRESQDASNNHLNQNIFCFIGRLGSDPVLRTTQKGQMVSFDIACNEYYKGEKNTQWIKMAIFNKTAENAANILSKGRLVYAEGKVHTSEYEKDGEKKSSTGIIVRSWKALDKKPGFQGSNDSFNQDSYQSDETNGFYDADDDEIPF
ncbi:Single-stranded DNA-binding protein [Desulfonema limicola]|uniref:Single-stranded DNA-binding protein n=1 Tax=Desulfonema limicola TaxID=45656 RepID=A0A975GJQ6_9BACT|nr:single-stranded DNA-binding protein [Desulfonema limicola]QTA83849.1 Single-stranded DNA-binding protein [Desulfonema limicola]